MKFGVWNPNSLSNIHELVKFAKTLHWKNDKTSEQEGVISVDIIAPSNVDHIEQAGLGAVHFEWLMSTPPKDQASASKIAQKAAHIPLLQDTLISQDRKAIALYLPITSKSISYQVAEKLREKITEFGPGDDYHITGLPVAQDQFGVEMFKQMAISAPMAMLLIFLLMWWFFRQVKMVMAPLLVAMIAVIFTMGLLVLTGNTIHIMSSMIPIFIMPIAVLDSVHILSDFFDRFPQIQDRKRTLKIVMEELSSPMLYTTLTTCAGFASLAFTPIPPVQVFGIFVAVGVFSAWLLTVTLIPAYIMLMKRESLSGFGFNQDEKDSSSKLNKLLRLVGSFTLKQSKFIVLACLGLIVLAAYGIQQIRINDNPVKWFNPDHPIRIADKTLNERFSGTYMAYLTLKPKHALSSDELYAQLDQIFLSHPSLRTKVEEALSEISSDSPNKSLDLKTWLTNFLTLIHAQQDKTETDQEWEQWDRIIQAIGVLSQRQQVFKQPEMLRYIAALQQHLKQTGLVGKSNGLPDIVKTVHRELFLGEQEEFRIPSTASAVGQTLVTYESSHRPQDLWHFVTPDYRLTNLWIQLKSGDNKDMSAVVEAVDNYMASHPAPVAIQHDWFGLTYINVVWQEKMVSGMLKAFLGSFIIVLLMMIFLFRSIWWGVLSMLPLLLTICTIYGIIGLIGKDYDMPVAVLSALSLGLAIDYAIHFLARSRQLHLKEAKDNPQHSWPKTIEKMFQEPARAISRNVIVIGVGFLPLLLAPLVPYQTVGIFISAILVLAGAASLLLLPALMTLLINLLFADTHHSELTQKEAAQ